ncbi:hypothetical protein llg_25860 [Luteolibacter sp. LG18]|nr:hypothetical protein llg_25860 [Luteolibacter sp. LG18]
MLDPDHVVLRPLAVARSSRSHQWTAANAMDPEVIKDIAHNPDEFIRMIEENDRIKRRQLVYRNETVPMLLQRVGGDAASLRSLMLPALDGREVEIEVTGTQLLEGLRSGTVTGRVKGRFNSMATVGFYNGCESFNIISPDDGLYLIADAREPGEVFLKEIDPDRYAPLPCGSNAVTQASH